LHHLIDGAFKIGAEPARGTSRDHGFTKLAKKFDATRDARSAGEAAITLHAELP
jgi:hypothetical protein